MSQTMSNRSPKAYPERKERMAPRTKISSLYRTSNDQSRIEEQLNKSILAGKEEGEVFAETVKLINLHHKQKS